MLFGVVSGVDRRGMCVLERSGDRRREGQFWGVNLGRPNVTNGAFATRSSQITLRTCYYYYESRYSNSARKLPELTDKVICYIGFSLWLSGKD